MLLLDVFNRDDVQRIQSFNKIIWIQDGYNLSSEQDEFGMSDFKFSAVGQM